MRVLPIAVACLFVMNVGSLYGEETGNDGGETEEVHQIVRIVLPWPDSNRNLARDFEFKFKDGVPSQVLIDRTKGVEYVVTPGEGAYRERINLRDCKITADHRGFRWSWYTTRGQNHIIRIHLHSTSPSITASDVLVTDRTNSRPAIAIETSSSLLDLNDENVATLLKEALEAKGEEPQDAGKEKSSRQ